MSNNSKSTLLVLLSSISLLYSVTAAQAGGGSHTPRYINPDYISPEDWESWRASLSPEDWESWRASYEKYTHSENNNSEALGSTSLITTPSAKSQIAGSDKETGEIEELILPVPDSDP